jgi:hypothetical protein
MRTKEEILQEKFPNASQLDWYKPVMDAIDEHEREIVQHFTYWCVENGWIRYPKLDRWKNNSPTHAPCTTEELFNKFAQNKTQI